MKRWIKVYYRSWKGRRAAAKKENYEVILWRNYRDVKYCPVFFLSLLLNLTGIKKGPIFAQFNADGVTVRKAFIKKMYIF